MNNKKHTMNQAESMLDELKQLDERLERLQKAFALTKTGRVKDSLLTPENITKSIQLLKKINPSEKHMMNALESLMPFAKKSDEELARLQAKQTLKFEPNVHNNNATVFTKKLKCRLPQNKII